MRPQKRVHRRAAKALARDYVQQGVEGVAPVVQERVDRPKAPAANPYIGLPRLDLKYGLSRHMRETSEVRKCRPNEAEGTAQERADRLARYQAMVDLARAERAKRC